MTTDREAWLALTKEEAIDPELPICDPHHHWWNRSGSRYELEELLQDTGSGHNIVDTVFVECRSKYREDGPEEMRPVGEMEYVVEMANRSDREQSDAPKVAAGIVGHADLTLGTAVKPVLEALITAGKGRFSGIRHSAVWDGSPEIRSSVQAAGLLLEPKFREGLGCLEEYGLSYDVWMYHPQLTELADLARAYPGVTIILDHIGGKLGIGPYAGKQKEVFEDWSKAMTELAACPNVVVKLGGLGMPICGFDWHERTTPIGSEELAESLAPYYGWCIEQFGANRCMFESNFPVDKVSYSYTVMWNAFQRLAKDFSAEERAALFHDTAARVYRLTANRQG